MFQGEMGGPSFHKVLDDYVAVSLDLRTILGHCMEWRQFWSNVSKSYMDLKLEMTGSPLSFLAIVRSIFAIQANFYLQLWKLTIKNFEYQ